GTGIEQVKAPALHVLLRLRPRLRGDDGDVTAGGCGVGEPGRQQRRLHTPPAVRGRGRGTGELRDALRWPETATAGPDPIPPRGIARAPCPAEVTLGSRAPLPGEAPMAGYPLAVGVGEAID